NFPYEFKIALVEQSLQPGACVAQIARENGINDNESSPLQSSLLVSERMAFKLHRQGMIMETIGKNNAVCNEYPSPILPKERWRYQMVNMYPDSGQCHPFGRRDGCGIFDRNRMIRQRQNTA
ncbi:TraU family protein, partial [Escherichia coli]|uniref:TraU family protein n=1 Tax=Escherichia coli TaxID=562 RepID=UPI001F4612B7